MHWMVLHRPFEPTRQIGQVEASTHMDGYRVNQDLVFIRSMIETRRFCSTARLCLTKLGNRSNVRNSPFQVVSLNS
jgi:hypothetical protein